MMQFQKVIKYLAIALAVFIIFQILSFFMNTSLSFSHLFEHNRFKSLDKISVKGKINGLEIDVKASNVFIEKGKSFRVESDNEYLIGRKENNKLIITEEKHNWIKNKDYHGLTIYLPDDFIFDSVDLKAGAGKVAISYLATKVLNLELGAGKADIDYLSVLENGSIHGGVGSFSIHHGTIHNLDLEVGVGKTNITSSLLGHNKIESGIGALTLCLVGDESDYQINVEKGIGNISIQKEKMRDQSSYGDGDILVDLKGGIGSVEVVFEEKNTSL